MSGNGRAGEYGSYGYGMTTTQPPLSAAQREEQRIAYIAAVDALSKVTGALVPQVDALIQAMHNQASAIAEQQAHIDALERVTAARWNLPFWYRLRWLVLGR